MNFRAKIHWVIIVAEDLKKLRDFYSEKLGLRLVQESISDGIVQFQLGNQIFALYSKTTADNIFGQDNISEDLLHTRNIYLFPPVHSVDEAYNDLVKKGVKFLEPPKDKPWGHRIVFFKDPEGNMWGIYKLLGR